MNKAEICRFLNNRFKRKERLGIRASLETLQSISNTKDAIYGKTRLLLSDADVVEFAVLMFEQSVQQFLTED